MRILLAILKTLTLKERRYLIVIFGVFVAASLARISLAIQENSELVAAPGGIYREGIVGQPIAVNPVISANVIDQDINALVYGSLFDLITSYEIDDDNRIFIIKLKEDLKWSDGEPLTSDDIIFTLRVIQEPESGSPLLKAWQSVAVERISELQVQFALSAPYSFFTENLKRLPIIPKHVFGAIPFQNLKLSSYNLEPIGNGPYRFKGYSKRKDGFITQYHLEENEYFAGDKPFIKDFYFRFYENTEELLKAFRMREINGFGILNPLEADEILQKKSVKIVVEKIAMPRYYAIFYNQNINPLLKNHDLRYALNAAIPKELIAGEILRNYPVPIESPIMKSLNEFNGADYNFEKARARFESLKNPNIELNLIVPNVDFLENTAKIIRERWLAMGVKNVNLIVLNSDDILQDVIKPNNYEMILFGNTLENPLDLFPFWHSSMRFYPGLNLALYQNQKVDNLIEAIRETNEPEKRLLFLKEAEELIIDDMPAIFLFEMPYFYIHLNDLGGFKNEARDFFSSAADRFLNINKWHLAKVRVIKNP